MAERKNQSALTAQERQAFVDAVLQLKANGGYDRYVREHQRVFELGGPAHGGPAFLPWHREYLRQLEVDLQRIDPTVTLPYWDWTIDRTAGPPLWADAFMGGGGDGPDDIVTSGPFALAGGRWRLTVTQPPLDPGPALRRTLGPTPPLPTAAQMDAALRRVPYAGFSQALEVLLHNGVHVWVGRTMSAGTSPNDPVFWLHHCNVDRLWAVWQFRHPEQPPYLQTGQGPPGHRLDDPLPILGQTARPRDLVDHRALGYTYDTDVERDFPVLTVGAPPLQVAVGAPGEVDSFRFVVAAAGSYTVETSGPTDVVMSLFGPNDPDALVAEDDDSGQARNARIQSQLSAGTYLVRVRHFQPGGTGAYGIAVRGQPAVEPVPEITVNGPAVDGSIQAANESDLYSFAAITSALYTVETAGLTDTFVTLFGPNSESARIAVDDDSGPGRNSRVVIDLAPGTYFVRVRHYSPTGTGAYSISVSR